MTASALKLGEPWSDAEPAGATLTRKTKTSGQLPQANPQSNEGGYVTDTNVLLLERAKTHGAFSTHAEIAQRLEMTMMEAGYKNWASLAHTQREALHMIVHKIGRILAGNPDYADHWQDICGYSQLIVNELSGRKA